MAHPRPAWDFSPERIEEMLLNNTYERVLSALVERKSMAFLELTSVCNVEDDELKEIINRFSGNDLISVAHPDNMFREVITLNDKGFALARQLAKEDESIPAMA
jgi:DNA-binding MarR family transcriptional regulator